MSNDLTIHKLWMQNFMSYGNKITTVNLDGKGMTLIRGVNLDDTVNGIGANGVGKFQHIDSLVKTPSSWIRMGDIKPGQLLQMPDGSVSNVIKIFPQGKQPLYRVTFADGRSTLAGGPHLWSVFSHRWGKSGTRGTKTITTDELSKYIDESNDRDNKPWYNVFVPTVTHPSLPDKQLPINPYLLGVLLGDGSMSSGSVMLTSADPSLISECDVILSDYHQTLKQCNLKTNNSYDWTIANIDSYKYVRHSGSIKTKLQELNLFGCVSSTKFIPSSYMEGTSKQQKLDILSGLLDTDGTVNKTKNVSYCSVSKQLAEDVQYLVRSLGGQATITTRSPFCTNDNGEKIMGQLTYNVSIKYADPRNLFRLERKKERLSEGRTQYSNQGLRVVSIDQVENGECQCIMVDHPDHLYITDNFVVTHNTTIINALVYSFYGESMGDSKVDELINDVNKKKCIVGVEFSIGKNRYSITRYRKMKAGAEGTYTNIFMNDDIDKDSSDKSRKNLAKATLPETNKMTIDLVGMPKELFIRLVVFDADEQSFFKMKAGDQREVMEHLFHLTILSEKADVFRNDQRGTKKEIEIQENSISFLEKQLSDYKTQTESAKKRVVQWERDKKIDLVDSKQDLEELDGVDIEYEKTLFDSVEQAKKDIAELNTKIAAIRLKSSDSKAEVDQSDNDIRLLKSKRATGESKVTRLRRTVEKLEKEVSTLESNKCPECLQALPDADGKIDERKSKIEEAEGEITSAALEHDTINDDIEKCNHTRDTAQDNYDSIIAGVKSLLEEISDIESDTEKPSITTREKLNKIESQREAAKLKIVNLESSENPHVDAFTELDEKEIDDVDYTEMNDLKKLLDHQKFLLKLLTDKKSYIRQRLVNKRLPHLNERLTVYLKQLGLPYQVEFQSDLTAKIIRRGKTKSFSNLSHGQRARVNFALSFAFRDVMERINRRVNVCMLDEVLDKALCDVGANAAITMISDKCKSDKLSIFVITHKKEIANRFDKVMTVTMERGFSKIK